MAQGDDRCSSFQLISGDGWFNDRGLDDFSQKVKLSQHGVSYAVVSIIGPQSSGKSTLLNHLFRTNFKVMDATGRSSQTTHGIWLAKAADIDPCTLIMDVEGSDSSEREEDIIFEKQSALFALAMSDITLINLWYHDIGREQAGCRALLKPVFQVMMRLYTERKRTLLFVIRDKNPETSLKCLGEQLLESTKKIFDSVYKPEGNKRAKLSDFFDVHVRSLPNYQTQEFKEEVDRLRQCFIHSTTSGGLVGDYIGKSPASGISTIAKNIWKEIVENKDLDLPMLRIMVAKERCEEILNGKFDDFSGSEDWRHVKDNLRSGPVKNFGKRMTLAICNNLSKYDKEALFYDEKVQSGKRQILQNKLLQLVQPAYQTMLDHLYDAALNSFQENLKAHGNGESLATAAQYWSNYSMSKFDKGCEDAAIEQATWDFSSSVRAKLKTAIKTHTDFVQSLDDAARARQEAQEAARARQEAQDEAARARQEAQDEVARARQEAARAQDEAARARQEAARPDGRVADIFRGIGGVFEGIGGVARVGLGIANLESGNIQSPFN